MNIVLAWFWTAVIIVVIYLLCRYPRCPKCGGWHIKYDIITREYFCVKCKHWFI